MKSTFVGNQAQTRVGVDDLGLTQLRVKKSKHSKMEGRIAVLRDNLGHREGRGQANHPGTVISSMEATPSKYTL